MPSVLSWVIVEHRTNSRTKPINHSEFMSKEEYKNEMIKNLQEVIKAAQNNIDALHDDDFCVYLLTYEGIENSMNYIRLLTNKVQLNMKKFKELN